MEQPHTTDRRSHEIEHRCNHPLAVVIDPSDCELRQLEEMLAQCPVCSRWSPGDGPIMAILSTGTLPK